MTEVVNKSWSFTESEVALLVKKELVKKGAINMEDEVIITPTRTSISKSFTGITVFKTDTKEEC